ncbi:hypothetical protein MLP_27340 [Microlunatus phosphovorus NM-1]|uniref:Uncharacterized protein n=1 Tax=Microlunatus phosphovorus (strain ATCC 700054 / DSM 10555 / JCM 9379 / NBRC 101784 / NCIMB 13414 / VKM Ac-1990 / NM-1) TaxID=1032480 RepID=F5XI79_MICPN|nr:hypothetical protein MLP_27340 [Microlunatus phosphovorus NM-1]
MQLPCSDTAYARALPSLGAPSRSFVESDTRLIGHLGRSGQVIPDQLTVMVTTET